MEAEESISWTNEMNKFNKKHEHEVLIEFYAGFQSLIQSRVNFRTDTNLFTSFGRLFLYFLCVRFYWFSR